MDYSIWYISYYPYDRKVRVRLWESVYDVREKDKDVIMNLDRLASHLTYLDYSYPTAKFEMD